MEKVTTKRLALYSGRTHPELAQEVATHLNIELGHDNLVEFSNGEVRCRFGESIRGSDVFVIQSHYGVDNHSVNDSIMEHLIMIDAAYRASAKRITAVCPFYGYARQDRKAEGREPITARLIADMFKAAGAKRMISIDLHSGQIQGFFEGPVDHLTAMPVLEDYIRSQAHEPVIVSPDAGRIKVAERMAQHLGDCGADLAFIYKRRPKGTTNVAEAAEVMGDVEGRLCVITDDMIDTAGTICAAAELLIEQRGAREVWAMATHGVLSGPAIDRLKNAPIDRDRAHQHAAAAAREAARQDRSAVGRPADRRSPRRRVRRHQRQRHLRRREPGLTCTHPERPPTLDAEREDPGQPGCETRSRDGRGWRWRTVDWDAAVTTWRLLCGRRHEIRWKPITMSETVLTAEVGRRAGSSDSRRLRTEGKIPAVVYGHGMDPISVSVDRRELRQALSGAAGMNTILDLTVDGTVYPSLIKDIQRHPVKRSVQHIDFIQVNLNEEIVVSIPIHLEGEAKDVSQNNGLVDLTMQELEVRTTPRSIPDGITIDVSEMTMDTVIRVEDLPLPAGVTAEADPEAPVVTVLTMRTPVLDEEEAAAEAAAAEAEAGEGESGESADAAADSDGE